MNPIQLCPAFVVLLATLIATITDLRSFKIYNLLTVPMILSGIIYHATFFYTAGLVESLEGACFGGGMLLIGYLFGAVGAGDVKLMAGVGAWLGLPATFYILIASSLAAGLYSLVYLARYGGVNRTLNNLRIVYYQMRAIGAYLGPKETAESLVESGDTRRLIPYGAMIVLGTIAWFARELFR